MLFLVMSPNTVTPSWVEKESVDRFVKIKMKLTAIAQATAEIDRFVEEDMPDDNELAAAHKQAGKRADKPCRRCTGARATQTEACLANAMAAS